jgi:hypothetical protein
MAFSAKFAILAACILLLASTTAVFAQTTPITVTSPTTANLNSVCIASNQTTVSNATLNDYTAWAVGDGGTILYWNGSAWTVTAAPNGITDNLYQVLFVNETSGWAVGGSANHGVILNYNGSDWNVWNQVSYRNATNIGGPNDTINATLYGVVTDMSGSTGWIVGSNGNVLIFNGTYWIGATNQSMNTLRSVSMVHNNASAAWACGDNGTIMQWTGSAWVSVATNTTATLRSIIMVDSMSGWIVGGDGNSGVILNLNGTTWNNYTNISFNPSMDMTNITGNDTVNATLYSLSMTDVDSAWAVGGNGTVLFWDGNVWSGQTGISSSDLKSVFMLHALTGIMDIAWAVGNGGAILGWTGTVWIPEFSPILVSAVFAGTIVVALALVSAKKKRS